MAYDTTPGQRQTPQHEKSPADTTLIMDDARPTLPDLATYPPAVRQLIATLTAQVIHHCTIPASEIGNQSGRTGQGGRTMNPPDKPTVEITPAIQAALDDIGEAIFACVRRKHEKRAQEEERRRVVTATPDEQGTQDDDKMREG